jgi:HEAT repeat protein
MIEKNADYNEPLAEFEDRIPELEPVAHGSLPATVQARIGLERNLRVCGRAQPEPTRGFTTVERRVLQAMLNEFGSPLSASLRIRAAAAAGPAGLTAATRTLRNMALDDHEDRGTRQAAISSYLQLVGERARRDLSRLLASNDWTIRFTAYVSAMRHAPALEEVVRDHFARERDSRLRRAVQRRIGIGTEVDTTTADE